MGQVRAAVVGACFRVALARADDGRPRMVTKTLVTIPRDSGTTTGSGRL